MKEEERNPYKPRSVERCGYYPFPALGEVQEWQNQFRCFSIILRGDVEYPMEAEGADVQSNESGMGFCVRTDCQFFNTKFTATKP